MENQQKEQLRKEFEIQYANHPANLFEWFWKRLEEKETEIQNLNHDIHGYRNGHEINSKRYTEALSELNKKEELLKSAEEVIESSKHVGNFAPHENQETYEEALKKYNSLKTKS